MTTVRVDIGSSQVAANKATIDALAASTASFASQSATVTQHDSDISDLQTDATTKDSQIATNQANITLNAGEISTLDAAIAALQDSQPQRLLLSSDFVTSSNTLQTLADLTPTLDNGKTYLLRYMLMVNQLAVSDTRDMQIRIDHANTDFGAGMVIDHNANRRIELGTAESVSIETAGVDQYVIIEALIKTAAAPAGTPSISLAAGIETNEAAYELTVLAGSACQVTPVG